MFCLALFSNYAEILLSLKLQWISDDFVLPQGEIYFSALIPRHFSYVVLTLDGDVSTLSAPVSGYILSVSASTFRISSLAQSLLPWPLGFWFH